MHKMVIIEKTIFLKPSDPFLDKYIVTTYIKIQNVNSKSGRGAKHQTVLTYLRFCENWYHKNNSNDVSFKINVACMYVLCV